AIVGGSDFLSGLDDLNHALRLQRKLTGLYINRAFLRYNLDDFNGAMADYDYAVELDPANRVALYNRGLLRTEVRDINKAIDDFSRVIAMDPEDYRSLYNRAVLYHDIKDYPRALADLNKVIEAYPQFAGAYSLRTDIYRNMGEMRKAEADYKQMQTLMKPAAGTAATASRGDNDAEASSSADSRKDEPEETQAQVANRFKTLLTIETNTDPDREYNNASIRGKVQDRNLSIAEEPMFTLSFYTQPTALAETTYFSKEVDDLNATRMLRFLVMMTNREPQITRESEMRKHLESIEYYNSLIANQKPRAIDYFGRAMDYMTIRNYRAAVDDLSKAIELTPDFTLGYFLRSVARYRLAQFERACLVELSPAELPMATDGVKILLSEARADIEKAIVLSPRFAMAYYN
ncbi:MAG: tetratricopeptide repeat protein, partial [Muribaculaceae bacterium]|nr:tetratricopeptide repeat protein [Muribaculaceae bacterium]